jgi:hypothetical protein
VDPAGADGLRIGTAEREAAMTILGEHLAKGRLELAEYEERVTAAIRARTRGDLRPLFEDLPPPYPTFLLAPAPLRPAAGLPEELRAALTAEGVLALAEDIRGSITYRNYRAPGENSNWAREWLTGTVALTGRRLVVWAGGAKRVDVPYDHPLRGSVEMTVDKPNRLCIATTPHAGANWSGSIELRFTTPLAGTIAELWGSRR